MKHFEQSILVIDPYFNLSVYLPYSHMCRIWPEKNPHPCLRRRERGFCGEVIFSGTSFSFKLPQLMTSSFLATINSDLLINQAEKLQQGKKTKATQLARAAISHQGWDTSLSVTICFDCKVDALLASLCQTEDGFESGVRLWLLNLTHLKKTHFISLVCRSPDFILISIFSQVFTQL